MALKNDWIDGDEFTALAANGIADAVNLLSDTYLQNLGGLTGVQKMTESEYAAITPTDDVLYVVVAD